jgi:ribulose-phosphate 3-epimerase
MRSGRTRAVDHNGPVPSRDENGRDAGIRINPSILAADFVNMQAELARIATADFVHVDVMDNHFVPNLTFGPQMVERIQATSPVPLDVHLMITDPDRWAPGYAEVGAASVTFHLEAAAEPVALARRLREIGARAGVAVKPATPVDGLFDLLDDFDQILVMTVEPGFGGQSFMLETMPKLRRLAQEAHRRGSSVWLQVDGGIGESTIVHAAEAGADTFVAGSAVFGAEDPARAITGLRAAAAAHPHRH